MRPSLPAAPIPKERETVLSLVGRAAAQRGLSLQRFCIEVGLSARKLIDLDESQIDPLGRLFGLDPSSLSTLISWSSKSLHSTKVRFRDEVFGSRCLVSPTVRGCPSCLREDLEYGGPPAMAMRGHWHLKFTDVCIRHSSALVPLWTVQERMNRYDFSSRFHEVSGALQKLETQENTETVTAYDQWLDDRLSTQTDPTWLRAISTEAAATFTKLLGAELARAVPDRDTPSRALGFRAIRQGPEALRDALIDLATAAAHHQDKPNKAFGGAYRWLAKDMANDPRYDPFRDIMRQVILDRWAMPAGEVVLGHKLPKRLRHSVVSAAKEVGRTSGVVRDILAHHKVIPKCDQRYDVRLTFPVSDAENALSQAKRLVIAKEMADRLGCTVKQLKGLWKEGLIEPAIPIEVSKLQWDTKDADDFIVSFSCHSQKIDTPSGWKHIGVAAARARVSLKDAVKAVQNGKIASARLHGQHGYQAIMVRQSDVNKLGPPSPPFPTMAEFAQQVGLLKNGEIRALHAAGLITATKLFNPATRRHGLYFTDADQDAFKRKFTTLSILSAQHGIASREVAKKLRDLGVGRVSADGLNFKHVFRVEDVFAADPNWNAA